MKKKLLTLLSILILILCKNIYCLADGEIYCSPDSSENLTVLCQYVQDSVDLKYDTEAGRTAYFIPNSSTQDTESYTKYGRVLNFYIDDNIFFGNSTFENIEIVIEYKDLGLGSFYVTYDSHDGEKVYKDYTELYNTNEIKTAVIALDDARFSNNCNNEPDSAKAINKNADFSITAPRLKDGEGIYIYSVAVRMTGTWGGIKICSDKSVPGNIFFDGTDKKICIVYENLRSSALDMNTEYAVIDAETQNVCAKYEKLLSVQGSATVYDSVNLDGADRYGTYILRIRIEQDGLYVTKDIPFSVCITVPESARNALMGTGAHFNWGRESSVAMEIMNKIGITCIRDGYNWAKFEKEKGVYEEPESYTSYLYNAQKNNFDMLVAATYGNTLYGMTSQQYMPETDEQRQAYVNYILEMLRLNHDKIDVIEVWNEPDTVTYNPGAYDRPEVYIRLLQAVSEAVRSEYPHVRIAGPALSSATLAKKKEWLELFLTTAVADDNGNEHFASEYFDTVTIHHYALNYDRSIKKTTETLGEIKALLEKYGCGEKEIYHTEFGSTHLERVDGSIKENALSSQAAKLSRYYLGLCGTKAGSRYYIYDFSDDGFAENVMGYNYGLTSSHEADVPYAAKPSLLAVANINKLTGGKSAGSFKTVAVDGCSHTEQHYAYEITFGGDADESVVTAIFTDNEDVNYTFNSDKETVFYDIYGNLLEIEPTDGAYALTIGQYPVFAVIRQYDAAVLKVYSENGSISSVNEFYADSNVSITAELFDANQQAFDIIVGYYNSNSLLSAKVINSSAMIKDENKYTYRIDNDINEDVNCIKIFLWDSVDQIRPITSKCELN